MSVSTHPAFSGFLADDAAGSCLLKEPNYHIRAFTKEYHPIFKKKDFKIYQGIWLSEEKKQTVGGRGGVKKRGKKEEIRATVQRGKMLAATSELWEENVSGRENETLQNDLLFQRSGEKPPFQ